MARLSVTSWIWCCCVTNHSSAQPTRGYWAHRAIPYAVLVKWSFLYGLTRTISACCRCLAMSRQYG